MKTVTIYAHKYEGEIVSYKLTPAPRPRTYEWDDDGGEEYILPEGFEVSQNRYGQDMIFASSGIGCELGCIKNAKTGKPQPAIKIGEHDYTFLRRANKHAE